ncbi:MAG: adenosylmethionine decarboxylase [Desulfobacterales bacterium]|nr:adenosylmethionine decarboxylase [Desulfobacterales bacterium]
MNQGGAHIIMDIHGCDPGKLDDMDFCKNTLEGAAIAARSTIVKTAFHKFAPQGVTGFCLVQESHLSIHTWPECGFAAVDIFMCGREGDPQKARKYILEALGGEEVQVISIERGKIPSCEKDS